MQHLAERTGLQGRRIKVEDELSSLIEAVPEKDSELEQSIVPTALQSQRYIGLGSVRSPRNAAYGMSGAAATLAPPSIPTFSNADNTQLVTDSELDEYEEASDPRVRNVINMPRQIHDSRAQVL